MEVFEISEIFHIVEPRTMNFVESCINEDDTSHCIEGYMVIDLPTNHTTPQ